MKAMSKSGVENGTKSDGTKSEGILRWIGDLDHPFYSDERNRFVWYEASAIAFQLILIGSYLAAGLMFWVGGSEALPYALTSLAPVLLGTLVFHSFTAKHRVLYAPGKSDFKRLRGLIIIPLTLFVTIGAVKAIPSKPAESGSDADSGIGGIDWSTISGAFVGVLACGLFIGFIVGIAKKRTAVDEQE